MAEHLPFDIKLKIIQFLDAKDTIHVGATCKEFLAAAKDESLWKDTLKLSIEDFTMRDLKHILPHRLVVVRYMTNLKPDRSLQLQRTRADMHVTFVVYSADFDTHSLVAHTTSRPGDRLVSLFNHTALPADSPRFVSCMFGAELQHRLLFWCPEAAQAKKEYMLWDTIFDSLVVEELDEGSRCRAGTIQEAVQLLQIPNALQPQVREVLAGL